ncbi:MAG: translation elongation factor Ts [Bacilli bacterium]|nr:translation elongation factor Ts [Bacilli bacterium]MDD7314168.1 translation elongation factor Ts [Bacilli bacterium]MDY4052601.1 translation elongation factor Ts [Bacilli bacterium]
MITASLVKELREKTGAGMMDCKKALTECNGNIEAAIDWLREKGIAKAAKKATRIAAEGLCDVAINGNKAYLYELNSETDFVAKNEKFLNLLHQIGEACVASDAACEKCALAATYNGQTVEDLIIAATAVIGEKISLRRMVRIEKADDEVFGVYKHNGGKIVVVSVIKGTDALVAKDICMHVAMYNPRYLDEASINQEDLDHESDVIKAEIANDPANASKPANIIEKMAMGRLAKFKKEICLVDQAFVKDPSVTVAQYLKSHNSSAVAYVRYEVGEGMEKRADDFAAEVAAATAAAKANN